MISFLEVTHEDADYYGGITNIYADILAAWRRLYTCDLVQKYLYAMAIQSPLETFLAVISRVNNIKARILPH